MTTWRSMIHTAASDLYWQQVSVTANVLEVRTNFLHVRVIYIFSVLLNCNFCKKKIPKHVSAFED
jgi:hypothetical protein